MRPMQVNATITIGTLLKMIVNGSVMRTIYEYDVKIVDTFNLEIEVTAKVMSGEKAEGTAPSVMVQMMSQRNRRPIRMSFSRRL